MNYDFIDHFIAVSYLYFLVTDRHAANVSPGELEELIVAINGNESMAHESGHYLV